MRPQLKMTLPYTSASGASAHTPKHAPAPSWTIMLMNFEPGALMFRLWMFRVFSLTSVFVTSKSQYHVYEPLIARLPSTIARSPGYCRTMIGLDDVPESELMYVPR